MIELNVRGLLRTGRAFADDLLADRGRRARRADLVHVGSVGGHLVFPTYAVYGATKAAVAHLTRNLRAELGPRGVRVKNDRARARRDRARRRHGRRRRPRGARPHAPRDPVARAGRHRRRDRVRRRGAATRQRRRADRGADGAGLLGQTFSATYFVSRYSCSPSGPPSRP